MPFTFRCCRSFSASGISAHENATESSRVASRSLTNCLEELLPERSTTATGMSSTEPLL